MGDQIQVRYKNNTLPIFGYNTRYKLNNMLTTFNILSYLNVK